MAKARPSTLEQAALALAALLAAVGEAVRGTLDRTSSDPDRLDQDKAKARSTARAIPRTEDSPARCSPDRGRFVTRRWHMSKISREYQTRVTGFEPCIEWTFANMEFDGFRSPECRLQEAKARYDQFFDRKTRLPKRFFEIFGVTRMMRQARDQSAVVRNNPPAKLTWYFMQPISHEYFSGQFKTESLPIESRLHP